MQGIQVSLEATRVEALCQMENWEGLAQAIKVRSGR